MTPEGRVKIKVKEMLKELGVAYFMPVGGLYGRGGVSDFICCVHGHFVSIEAKKDGKTKPTKLQERFITDIRNARGIAMVAYEGNLDAVRSVLKRMLLSGELQ